MFICSHATGDMSNECPHCMDLCTECHSGNRRSSDLEYPTGNPVDFGRLSIRCAQCNEINKMNIYTYIYNIRI